MEIEADKKQKDSSDLTSRLQRVLRAGMILLALFLWQAAAAAALRTIVIGDSLSAEYDALPGIPGVEDPTAYAAVTVPGWESRSWVEVLGLLRSGTIDFGQQKTVLPGWDDLRFTGYEYNFAIPGFTAAQYRDIVTSSLFSNPQYLTYRLTLSDVLRQEADVCLVWIGSNELRANYGFLCDGGDPTTLVQDLKDNIGEILDFVRRESVSVRLIVVNMPDLGACPSKQASCPDPARRQRATEATILANQAISSLATARNLPVVDVFAATRRIIEGQPIGFGPVDIRLQSDPDNNPRYAFTREGLHPNTGLQIEIARLILATLNQPGQTAVPPIRDGEALALLGIDPLQPYLDWAATRLPSTANGLGADPDGDGLPNLMEYLFDLDPLTRDPSPITISTPPDGPQATYQPVPDRTRLASVTPQWSTDLVTWIDVPADRLTTAPDGRVTVRFQPGAHSNFLRLQASVLPVP